MEIIRNIVQNILIIILLTVLLEMLLPEGDMRRYVLLVMGLFIIMVVLQPVLSLFHSGVNLETVSFSGDGQRRVDLNAAMERGDKIRSEHQSRALAGLKEKINGQVTALARLNRSVNVTGVDVEMVSDPKADNFGQIKKIIVKTGSDAKTPDKAKTPAGNAGNREVAPVEIDVPEVNVGRSRDKTTVSGGNRDSGQLRDILADFYGLAPEQVKIISQP